MKNKARKKNTYLQREVEFSSPELSTMEKGHKQKSVDIWPISFHNDNCINAQLESTGKILVALKPKSPLNYVVYKISEAHSSNPFNLLIRLRKTVNG